MTRKDAVKLLAKMREVVEHPATSSEERVAALTRIRQLKDKWKIGHYEAYEDLKPGRRKAPEKLRKRVVQFRVTEQEYSKLLQQAERAGTSLSDYLRDCVLAPNQLEK